MISSTYAGGRVVKLDQRRIVAWERTCNVGQACATSARSGIDDLKGANLLAQGIEGQQLRREIRIRGRTYLESDIRQGFGERQRDLRRTRASAGGAIAPSKLSPKGGWDVGVLGAPKCPPK